jgi:hypothetical protein
MEDIYHRIYESLAHIGVFSVHTFAALDNPPCPPLCIDHLKDDIYAVAQNREREGTLIPDPDFEIKVDHEAKTAEPLVCYGPAGKRVVYPAPGRVDLKVRNELAVELDRWLLDLIHEGFIRTNL